MNAWNSLIGNASVATHDIVNHALAHLESYSRGASSLNHRPSPVRHWTTDRAERRCGLLCFVGSATASISAPG
jgi:hypothetical protein